MKNLFIISIFLISFQLFSKGPCKSFERAADNLEPKSWIQNVLRQEKLNKEKGHKGEYRIKLQNASNATKYSYRFPGFEYFKFGKPDLENGWKKFTSNFSKSPLNGKVVGLEKKLDNGNFARIRIDIDEAGKPHYNIEMKIKDGGYKGDPSGNYKTRIDFQCAKGRTKQQCLEEIISMTD